MKYFPVILILLCALPILAQNEEEVVFNRLRIKGGFGGPMFEITSMDDQTGVSFGAGGGIILNDFFIGGFGQAANFAEHQIGNQFYAVNIAYGGLWMGYATPYNKVLHFFSTLKIAGGAIAIPEEKDDLKDKPLFEEQVFVVQPELGLEINLMKWCRVAITANYRIVSGIQPSNLSSLSNQDFNSPGGTLTLRFGKFSRNSGQ